MFEWKASLSYFVIWKIFKTIIFFSLGAGHILSPKPLMGDWKLI